MSTLFLVSVLHLVAICLLIGASRSSRLQLVALERRVDKQEKRLTAIEPAQIAELDHALTERLVAIDGTDADEGLRRLAALSAARANALTPRATAEDLLREFGFPAWPDHHSRSAVVRRYNRYRMSVYSSDGCHYAWTVTIEAPPPRTLAEEERTGWIYNSSFEQVKARAATEMVRLLADHGISVVGQTQTSRS